MGDFPHYYSKITRSYGRKPLVFHGVDLGTDLGYLLPRQTCVGGDLSIRPVLLHIIEDGDRKSVV